MWLEDWVISVKRHIFLLLVCKVTQNSRLKKKKCRFMKFLNTRARILHYWYFFTLDIAWYIILNWENCFLFNKNQILVMLDPLEFEGRGKVCICFLRTTLQTLNKKYHLTISETSQCLSWVSDYRTELKYIVTHGIFWANWPYMKKKTVQNLLRSKIGRTIIEKPSWSGFSTLSDT